jgi:hypothetical protein
MTCPAAAPGMPLTITEIHGYQSFANVDCAALCQYGSVQGSQFV